MPGATIIGEETADACRRFLQLYTGAIADMLDKKGYRNQVLPRELTTFPNGEPGGRTGLHRAGNSVCQHSG